VKEEFIKVVTNSKRLSTEVRDDFLKILSNPLREHDNSIRKVWGLPPLQTE
jgi:hypothetical protein